MFKDKVLETLKESKKKTLDEKTIRALDKIQKGEKLSSEEFPRIYDALWQEGPKTK